MTRTISSMRLVLLAGLLVGIGGRAQTQGLAYAPYQYIPPAHRDYFYNELVRAVRERCVVTGVGAPRAWGWFDGDENRVYSGQPGWRVTGVTQGQTANHPFYYRDANGNGLCDRRSNTPQGSGELVWRDNNANQLFDPGVDTLIAGAAVPAGAWGKQRGLFYHDANGSGSWDDAEEVWADSGTPFMDTKQELQDAVMALVPYFIDFTDHGGNWEGSTTIAPRYQEWEVASTVYLQADGSAGTTAGDLNRLCLVRSAPHNDRPTFTNTTAGLVLWYEAGVLIGNRTYDWFLSAAAGDRTGSFFARQQSSGMFGTFCELNPAAGAAPRTVRALLGKPGMVYEAAWATDLVDILNRLLWLPATELATDQRFKSVSTTNEVSQNYALIDKTIIDGYWTYADWTREVTWTHPWTFPNCNWAGSVGGAATGVAITYTAEKHLILEWMRHGKYLPEDIECSTQRNNLEVAWNDIRVRVPSNPFGLAFCADFYLKFDTAAATTQACRYWYEWNAGFYRTVGECDELVDIGLGNTPFPAAQPGRYHRLAQNMPDGVFYERTFDAEALTRAHEPPIPASFTDIGFFENRYQGHCTNQRITFTAAYTGIKRYDVPGGFHALANPPGDECPLTTEGDVLNTYPDSNRDDLVDIGTSLATFGPDTGTIAWQPDRDEPQRLIPLATGAWNNLAINAYLVQGAFDLPVNPLWTPPNASETHFRFACSTNTQARIAVLLTEPGQHLKRIEIVRPRGNAVVFDFPWDPISTTFGPVGYPRADGINEFRTYVLRDLTPDTHTDLLFDLQFDSGLTHHFNGVLTSVSALDGTTLNLYPYATYMPGVSWNSLEGTGGSSPRYGLAVSWTDGQPYQAVYNSQVGPGRITTTLAYDPDGWLEILTKSEPKLSVTRAGGTVTFGNGATVARGGSCKGGTVTITGAIGGAGSVTTEWTFNSHQLVTRLSGTINGYTDTADFAYHSGSRRCPNGAVPWSKLRRASYASGYWEEFEYATDTGWLTRHITPFKDTGRTLTDYNYDLLQTLPPPWSWPGMPLPTLDTLKLFERPHTAVVSINNLEISRTYWDSPWSWWGESSRMTYHCTKPGAAWNSTDNLTTNVMSNPFGPPNVSKPSAYTYSNGYPDYNDNSRFTLQSSNHLGENTTAQFTAFGSVTASSTTIGDNTVANATSQTGEFGRITRTDFLDNTHVEYRDFNWAGLPQTIVEPDRVVAHVYYRDSGLLDRIERPQLGTTERFTFDALGRVTAHTLEGGGLSVTTENICDVLGRLRRYTTPIGTTQITFSNCQRSVLYPDGNSATAALYTDQSLKELSGSAALPMHCDYGTGPAPGTAANADTQRTWQLTQLPADDGNFTMAARTYHDLLGRTTCTETQDEGGGKLHGSIAYAPRTGLPQTAIGPDGRHQLQTYDGRYLPTTSGLDVNGDGTPDAGDRLLTTSSGTGLASFGGVTKTAFSDATEVPGLGEMHRTTTAADGMAAAVTSFGRTAVATKSWDDAPAAWTVRATAADGSLALLHYENRLPARLERFDAQGNLQATTDYRFDGLGALTHETVTEAGNHIPQVTELRYDGARRLYWIQRPGEAPTEILAFVPGTARPATVMQPDGALQVMGYTPQGFLQTYNYVPGTAAAEDAMPYDLTLDYTPTGSVAKLTLSQNGTAQVTEWKHNRYTGRVEDKFINGVRVQHLTYTAGGQVATATDAAGLVATCGYAPATGDLTDVTFTAPGAPPGLALDNFDRLGRPGRRRDAATGISCSTFWNLASQATGETILGGGVVTGHNISRSYAPSHPDLTGVTLSAANGAWSQTRTVTYDTATRVGTVLGDNLEAIYEYHPGSRRVAGLTIKYRNTESLHRGFERDPLTGRLQTSSTTTGPTRVPLTAATYHYLPNTAKLDRITLANGAAWSYRYDTKGHLLAAELRNAGGAPLPGRAWGYQYDSLGNATAAGPITATGAPANQFMTDRFNFHWCRFWNGELQIAGKAAQNVRVSAGFTTEPAAAAGGKTATRVLNAANRSYVFPAETRPDGSFIIRIPVDNRNGPVYGFTTIYGVSFNGTQDDIASCSVPVTIPPLTERPASRSTGGVQSDYRFDFAFDVHGRLASVTSRDSVPAARRVRSEFTYYPDHRRARKRVYRLDAAGTAWTLAREHAFIYDGWLLAREDIAEFAPGATAPSRSYARRYLWGLDLADQRDALPADTGSSATADAKAGGTGGLLAVTVTEGASTRVLLPVADHNGNICQLVDAATATATAEYAYTPFGDLLTATGADAEACPLRFASKYWDQELGLYYYGYRYYDPVTAKWLSRDPLGETGGLNLTAFCQNDPVNRFDALGLADQWWNPACSNFLIWQGALWAGATTWTGTQWVAGEAWSGTRWLGVNSWNATTYIPYNAALGIGDWLNEDITGVYLVTYDDMNQFDFRAQRIGGIENNLSELLNKPEYDAVEAIWLNGQLNNEFRSELLATVHTPFSTKKSVLVIHNPSTGGVADTFQSAAEKLLWSSKISRQVAQILATRANRNIPTHLYFHSQGAVMGTDALRLLGRPTWLGGYGVDWSNAKAEYHGSASNYYVARMYTALAGVEWWGMENDYRDGVGMCLGLNTVNPAYILSSLFCGPSLGITAELDMQMDPRNPGFNNPLFFPWYRSNHTYYRPIMTKETWYRFFTHALY